MKHKSWFITFYKFSVTAELNTMTEFQFQYSTTSEKTGITTHQYKNDRYAMTIHTEIINMHQSILYPITINAIGTEIDVAPDIKILSKNNIDVICPPSIGIEQIPRLQQYLAEISDLIIDIKNILLGFK